MKREQMEIAEVLLDLGMDERLISFMTGDHGKQREENVHKK